MADSVLEAASTSSDCLSSEDSEPPPDTGKPSARPVSHDWSRQISSTSCQQLRHEYPWGKAKIQARRVKRDRATIRSSRARTVCGQESGKGRLIAAKRKLSQGPKSTTTRSGSCAARQTCTSSGCELHARMEVEHSFDEPLMAKQHNVKRSSKNTSSSGAPSPIPSAGPQHGNHVLEAGPSVRSSANDPIAQGLREEIVRVQRERQSMVEQVQRIDRRMEKLSSAVKGRSF